jgi:hypothetical protein
MQLVHYNTDSVICLWFAQLAAIWPWLWLVSAHACYEPICHVISSYVFFSSTNWEPASSAVITRRQHDEQLSCCYKSASGTTGHSWMICCLTRNFCNIQQRISTSIMPFLRPASLAHAVTHGTCLRCWHFSLLNKLARTFTETKVSFFAFKGSYSEPAECCPPLLI